MKDTPILLAGTACLASPALAQSSSDAQRRDPFKQSSRDIIVTAPYVRDLDILAGNPSLCAMSWSRISAPKIVEALVRQPGVSATSFGPSASRPVLRGFQGECVRVLTDGRGSLDVSNTSRDHAVTIDPLTAEPIEVLRGPAVPGLPAS